MTRERIKRRGVGFLEELQKLLAGLEKHLNVPAIAVVTDYLLLGKTHIRGNDGDPVLLVGAITHADNTRRYFRYADSVLFLYKIDIDRKKILGASTAFPAFAVNLLNIAGFPIILVVHFTGFLYHGNNIKIKLVLDSENGLGRRKPAVKQHIFCFVTGADSIFQHIYDQIQNFLSKIICFLTCSAYGKY